MMPKNTAQIIWLYLLLGFLSAFYFLSLVVQLPAIIPAGLIAVFGYISYKWLMKNIVKPDLKKDKPYKYLPYIIFLGGVAIITNKTFYLEQKYGEWDAWMIWNMHAKFLLDPHKWKDLFKLRPAYHSDYPLYLPATIAFFWRLLGNTAILVPYVFSFLTTLLVPVVIFIELYRKNLLVATLILIVLGTDDFYLKHAMNEYADVPLSLLLLLLFICRSYVQENKKIVTIMAALLGCCMWMKNEGAMLALIFTILNFKILFLNKNWKYSIPGLVVFIAALLLLKMQSPINDLMNTSQSNIINNIGSSQRYSFIYNSFTENLNNNFIEIKIGLLLYIVYCIAAKKIPQRNFWLIVCFAGGFFLTYLLLSPHLEWQLQTSMDRIILQLVPSTLYVLGLSFSNVRLQLADADAKVEV